jgi:hypothetical protein
MSTIFWNFIMLLGLDFMLLDQIANMSLNGLRRLVATHNKTQTWTRMDEYSISLDLRNWVLGSGGPPLSLCFP